MFATLRPLFGAAVTVTWVRQIGRPGHAGLYAWGAGAACPSLGNAACSIKINKGLFPLAYSLVGPAAFIAAT